MRFAIYTLPKLLYAVASSPASLNALKASSYWPSLPRLTPRLLKITLFRSRYIIKAALYLREVVTGLGLSSRCRECSHCLSEVVESGICQAEVVMHPEVAVG